MTKYANLVIMSTELQVIESALEQFLHPPDDPSQRLKFNRILGAAEALFVRHGYRKTSVSDIARQAGVAKGTVYLYFDNKPDLLLRVIAEEKRAWLNEMAAVLAPEHEPADRLKEYIRLAIRMSTRMPLTRRLLQGDMEIALVLSEIDPQLRDPDSRIEMDIITGMFEAAAAPHGWSQTQVRQRASVLVNLLFGSMVALLRTDLDVDEYADMVADMLVDGAAHR
jgi:AcrR family transcriptional regulator